jgi:hypothetical protein
MNWVTVTSSEQGYVKLQHNGLSRLEAVRLVLLAARVMFFRWEEFTPYQEYTTTGFGYRTVAEPKEAR